MKKLKFLLLAWIISVSLYAQELTVKSFLPSVNDLTARTEVRNDNGGNPCALVKVVLADKDVSFECGNLASMIVGDVSYHTNEYWVYLLAGNNGAKHLKIKHPNYPTIDVTFADFGFRTLEPKMTYNLVIISTGKASLFKPTRFYAEVAGQFGMMNAMGANLGCYIQNVNIEADYYMGISKSEEVFWNDKDGSKPHSYTYKPTYIGAKLGYGFVVNKHFCITPQLGLGAVSVSGSEVQKGDNNPDATKGYAMNMSFGACVDYLLNKHFGFNVTPEYGFAISKSNLFERVSVVSDKVKGFGSGFNVRIGLFVNF